LLGITYAGFDANPSDKNWTAALASACAQVRRQIEELGPFEAPRASSPKYVAAVCVKKMEGVHKILLVNTTSARKILPKGNVRKGECPRKAAVRYAYKEGGVLGTAILDEDLIFRYFKEESKSEHLIMGVLIDETASVTPHERFREPDWYELPEAERLLAERRDFNSAEELRKVVRWAESQVRLNSMPKEQVAALPFKVTRGGIRVLLVTSKTRHRWILPKGGVRKGLLPEEAAHEEALEEAGVEGYLSERPIGKYGYSRLGTRHDVTTYSMEVVREHKDWPEKEYRQRKWLKLEQAAAVIDDDELKQILLAFRTRFPQEDLAESTPQGSFELVSRSGALGRLGRYNRGPVGRIVHSASDVKTLDEPSESEAATLINELSDA